MSSPTPFTSKARRIFPDLNGLQISTGRIKFRLFKPQIQNSANGKFSLTLEPDPQIGTTARSDSVASMVPDDLLDAYVKSELRRYETLRSLLSERVQKIRRELVFELPGQFGAATNFTQVDGRTASATVEGKRFVEVLESFISDEAWFRNLSTTLRHRRFLFTDSFLLLWKWRVG